MDKSHHSVLLIADHKWRDLPGVALLADVLEEKYGLSAVVIPYSASLTCLYYFRPRVLTMSTIIGPREQDLARVAHSIGAAVVVIPTEGIPGSTDGMRGMFRSPDVWQACDLYLPWGTAMAKFAVSEGFLPKAKVQEEAGSARFDFYLPPLRRHLLPEFTLREKYNLRAGSPIITWAPGFILASYLDDEQRLRYNEEDFVQRGLADTQGYSNLRELVRQDFTARGSAFYWMREAAAKFPQAEFIVKPHPYAPREPYEQLMVEGRMSGLTNLHLVTGEYIWDLLNSASIHIHGNSTTGLEAWLMDVSTINQRPGGYARFKGAVGGALPALDWLDDNVEDGAAFLTRLDYYLNGGRVDARLVVERKRFLEQWLGPLDGGGAQRQAKAIAELVQRGYQPEDCLVRPDRRMYIRLFQYRLNEFLGRDFDTPFLGGYNGDSPHVGLRDRTVFQKDVREWTAKLKTV